MVHFNKEFRISLLVFLLTGAIITLGLFNENNLLSALITGYLGATSIFFVPQLFKNVKSNNDKGKM